MSAIKFEVARIHFLSDVFVAVAEERGEIASERKTAGREKGRACKRLVNPLVLRSKFEFSFVAPIHFLQK